MTATYTNQYRPVNNYEASTNAAVSVRTIVELADAMNNYKASFGPVVIADAFPDERVKSAANTAEHVILRFGKRFVGLGYNKINVGISGKQATAFGTDDTTWTLYAHHRLYDGPVTFNAYHLGLERYSSSVQFRTTANLVRHTSFSFAPDDSGYCYFTLTATDDSGSVQGTINAINVTPYVS